MKQKKAQWPWHLLTVVVLVGLAGALYYATSLMSYEWRWNRVPQYFAYQAETSQRAADISTVVELVRNGDTAEVTLRNDAGVEQKLTVADNSLQVARGDDVAEGDVAIKKYLTTAERYFYSKEWFGSEKRKNPA